MKTRTILAVFAIGAAYSVLSARAQEATAPTSTPGSGTSSSGAGHAAWSQTFLQARKRAASQNKLVLVEFEKPGCGECKRMDDLLYPAVQYEMTLLRMAPVKLKFGEGEAVALASHYGVHDAPATLIVAPGGALVFKLEGFDTVAEFYSHLHRSIAEYDRFNVRVVHEAEKISDPKEALALGSEFFRRFDSKEAVPRLERAAGSSSADEETRETAMAFLASAELDLGKTKESRATVDRLLERTKNPDRREKAELFRAQVSLAEGNRTDAVQRCESFLKRHPDSKLKPAAEGILAKLKESSATPAR